MDVQRRIDWTNRLIWILAPFVLSLLPFSNALRQGAAAGSGADVVNTLWAMWWFQQELPFVAWGGESTLFNFPFGGKGAILSPIFALCWSVLDSIMGPNWASLLTSILCLYGSMGLLWAIGHTKKWSHLSIGCMLLGFVCQRYFLFTLGETGVVGVAILPLLLCWYAVERFRIDKKIYWLVFIVLCIGVQGLENPYLAPVPPIIVLLSLWGDWRSLGILSVFGIGGLACIGSLYHGTSASEYQSLRPSSYTSIWGQYFPVVERSWARLTWSEFLFPQRERWPIGGQDTIHQAGRGFVGYSVLICGVLGSIMMKRGRVLLWVLGLWGVVFAMGSEWNGIAAPFALFNSICAQLVRALTQPTRFLLLTVLALSISVGGFVQWSHKKSIWLGMGVWFAMMLEALLIGGLSLRLPATKIPTSLCVSALEKEEGGVLVWPWDGIDDVDFDATLHSRLFQMVHGRPGATIGTGSWPLNGTVFPGVLLRDLGWDKAVSGTGTLDTSRLSRWGYKWAIVDVRASKTLRTRAHDDVFGADAFVERCGDVEIYRLPKSKREVEPAHPFSNRPLPVPKRE
jgi:hypothetical protein